jgi:simple sugar transport system permease protein
VRIVARWILFALVVFAIGSLLLLLVGVNPIDGWAALLKRSLGNAYGLSRVAERAALFSITALAFLLPFRAGIWNIGAEGQVMIGALAAYSVARLLGESAGALMLPTMFVAAFLGGMLWAVVPALIRLRLRGKEILTTLMLNYVAIHVVRHFANVVWTDKGYSFPVTKLLPKAAEFPGLARSEIHAGIAMAVVLVVLVAWLLRHTELGFDLRTHGGSERSARFAGVNMRSVILFSLLVGGGIAGLAGLQELSGGTPRLTDGIGFGLGYMGIPVALLANADPKKVPLSAIFFAVLAVGSAGLQRLGIPAGFHEVMLGAVILARLMFVRS